MTGLRESPQVVPPRVTYDRVVVILAKVDNPVIPIEGPEGGNLQLRVCGLVDHLGGAPDRLHGSIRSGRDDTR